jgi:hypothetical protein
MLCADTFAKFQRSSDRAAVENGLNYKGKSGYVLTSQFYYHVGRGRVRHLIKINGDDFGFVDFVTPFNIFAPPYEWYVLNFSTKTPFEFDGIEWEEEFYPPDDGCKWYMPTTGDIEAAIAFFDKMKR